ncbi:MAG TPA: polymer-forming cytoskeletal protein [Bacillota bacterium]|nr:polymer-forming cytoskeletal protein [Peptococcaceae bacterium MAG4]NLW37612.1 polymer-forming cytoskeletal protein [Peptococcaceae bacterium]HPU35637.1 polymer-forming cytoskeletal protein [Bacillota bacterium]HPZ42559.1 polymer-forming cytoskeletal protein [Bacillota bacterium]HQD76494.1 polymer-forming cytoskeletal protein [Bacillota bacterium]
MFKGKGLRKGVVIILVSMAVLGLAVPVGALETMSGESIVVPEGIVQGPLFATGNDVVVNGDVEGDVFAAGQTVMVNGRINGDLLAAARTVRLNGQVSGNVRCAAQDVEINGNVGMSLTAAGDQIRLLEGSRVGQDALVFGRYMTLSGEVGRQYLGSGENIRINGQVGGDIHLWGVKELNLGPLAAIGGSLSYRSPAQAEVAPGARVSGTTNWERLEQEVKKTTPIQQYDWAGALAWFAAGILVWGVLSLLFPGIWNHLSSTIQHSPGPVLGWGLLLLLVTPLAVLLLLVTVIGIPLSLTLLAAYAALLYAAKIIIGDAIGRFLARRFGWEGRIHSVFPFLIGYAGLVLLISIPVVGTILSIVIFSMAIGSVFLAIYRWRQQPLPAAIE